MRQPPAIRPKRPPRKGAFKRQSNPVDQKRVSLFIRNLRMQLGITQEALARYCGVSTRTIKFWENQQVMPLSNKWRRFRELWNLVRMMRAGGKYMMDRDGKPDFEN